MLMRQLIDAESSTYTYLLADEDTREAVILDPVLEQVDRDVALIRDLGLTLTHALDTHIHADHVTGAGALRERLGAKTVLSERAGVGCADVLVAGGDVIRFGRHALEVLETPGHTKSCVSYLTDDHTKVFTGDALLVRGCGRTDFQEGDAHQLYRSVHRNLFTLPPETTVYPAHDYKGHTATSIDEERRLNPRLGGTRSEEEFVRIMQELKLAYPKKIDVALPHNLRCGTVVQAAEPALQSGWYPVVGLAGIPEVTPSWVAEHRDEIRLIDVREASELRGELGFIEGAESIPLETLGAAGHDDARPTIIVCRSGDRSARAVSILHERNFQRVASMRGGMAAWNAAGLPVGRAP